MPSNRDKPKRWRPRFSVRTLVIVVTLVCTYFACLVPTRRYGRTDVEEYVRSTIDLDKQFKTAGFPSSSWPLVVWIYEAESDTDEVLSERDLHCFHRCYLWLFGYVVKLPIEYSVDFQDVPQPDETDE